MRDRHGRRPVRTALAAAFGAAATVALLVAAPRPAAAVDVSERITDLGVVMALRMDGSMHVTETITYDFGNADDRYGIERFVPVKFSYDSERNRVHPLSNARVTSPTGAPSDVEVTDADITTLRVGRGSEHVSGVQTYVIEYDLGGVVNTVDAGQELYWNAVGTLWPVPIERTSVIVTGPGAAVQRATCFQGGRGSAERCIWSVSGGTASFRSTRRLAARQGLTVVAGFPAGTFPGAAPILRDKWKISKAFAVDPVTGGTSAGVLAVLAGGTGLLVARRGRDRRYLGLTPGLAPRPGDEVRTARAGRRAPVAVRFTPPKDLRVGELGTLINEVANVVDVTATIIDLAVRGYLRIEEVQAGASVTDDDADDADDVDDVDDADDADDADDDWDEQTKAEFARLSAELDREIAAREEREGPDDWVLVTTDERADDLAEYEAELYDSIFEGRRRVRLSALRTTFSTDLSLVQTMLYAEVTEQGWFRANPRAVRTRWRSYGSTVLGVGIIVTVVLAIFTHLALVGLAVAAAGAVMVFLAGRMPARTAAGTALVAQALGFRLYLETAEADQVRLEEGQDVFSRYLPYAIVFGVAERWADVFASLAASGTAPPRPEWYVGRGHAWGDGFDYHHFGSSLDSFSSTTTSSIAASAPSMSTPSSSGSSGFSGGFSGGGGGGGGGGSW